MKKTDQRITKREIIDEKPMRPPVIDDDVCWKYDDFVGGNCHKPSHKPDPCPPNQTPQKPVPPKPHPTEIKYGDGLQVQNNVVSVKVDDKYCGEYMVVTKHGISIEPLLRKLDKMSRMLISIEKRLTDVESDVNKLKHQSRPETITQTIVEKSKSFDIDDKGLIILKTDESIIIGDNGAVGVDYDNDTITLIEDEEGNKKLSMISAEWNTEAEEDIEDVEEEQQEEDNND